MAGRETDTVGSKNNQHNDHWHTQKLAEHTSRSTTEQRHQRKAKVWAMQEMLNHVKATHSTVQSWTSSTYLNPSAFGMNRLGFGGSLWERGTFTGRGLFLGAAKENGQCQTESEGTLLVDFGKNSSAPFTEQQ